METPYPVVKKHNIGKKTYTIKPMSAFDLMALPDTLLGSLLQAVSVKEEKVTHLDVMMAMRGQAVQLVAEQIGCPVDDLKLIPAEKGVEIIADWMEVNLTENFIKALTRIVRAGKQIASSWSNA